MPELTVVDTSGGREMSMILDDLKHQRDVVKAIVEQTTRELAGIEKAITALEATGGQPRRPAGRKPLSTKAPTAKRAQIQRAKAGVSRAPKKAPVAEAQEAGPKTMARGSGTDEPRHFTGRLPRNVTALTHEGENAEKDARYAAKLLLGRGYVRNFDRPLRTGEFDVLYSKRTGVYTVIFVERPEDDRSFAKVAA